LKATSEVNSAKPANLRGARKGDRVELAGSHIVDDCEHTRCPSVDEMAALLDKAKQRLSPDQIWVNPDCGLKTRKWEEVRPALINMVHAARRIRSAAK
jgi:methionine synthase II (cobalamin-independent)